jgi:hypothetical protein
MRKITLFLSLVVCVMLTQAQNLLTNPSFETWTDGTPAPWYVVSTSVTGSVVSQDASIFTDGTKSFKINATGASGTVNWAQPISIVGGKTYTLNMSYYIASGDGTDARIWCNFKTGTTFMAEADLVATGLYPKLRGPGAANSSGSEYFPDVKVTWQTFTTEFTAPASVDGFDFQFRTYKTAVVYWDKMSLTEKTTGINDLNVNQFAAIVSGKNLLIKNIANGSTVEIYSALGSKIQTSVIENGKVSLNNLTRGMYVVRVNNMTQKIMY